MDDDDVAYPVHLLRQWRAAAEESARVATNRPEPAVVTIDQKIDLLISLHAKTPEQGLRTIVEECERLNPGLSVTAEVTSSDLSFKVSAKAADIPIGTLSFPSTQEGDSAKARFTLAMKEGRPVTLKQGEFNWKRLTKGPLNRPELETEELRITPTVPDLRVPVRLECGSAKIGFTTLRVLRIGQEELELEVGGDQFVGSMRFVSSMRGTGEKATGTLSQDMSKAPLKRLVPTLELLRELGRGAALRVIVLSSDEPILEMEGAVLGLSHSQYDNSVKLVRALITIDERFNLGLAYPSEEISKQHAAAVFELASAIEKDGKIEDPGASGVFTMTTAIEYARTIATSTQPITDFTAEVRFRVDIDGRQTPDICRRTRFQCVVPIEVGEELAKRIEAAGASGESSLEVSFEYAGLAHEYEGIMPST